MRKLSVYFIMIFFCFTLLLHPVFSSFHANELESENTGNYSIYTTEGKFLFEKSGVEIGDEYMSKDFKKYIVISLDNENYTGLAKFKQTVQKPKTSLSPQPKQLSSASKKFGLYMTHNAESYVIGDGTDSIYGAGGIHDVAKKLKQECEKLGIKTVIDETLHLPHNASAYNKSAVTAKRLLSNNPDIDAIFDVHRDGSSRASYVKTVNGVDKCLVRLVVGKSNPNFKANEQFAIYLMTVANELYPWLIKDIYYASGHYNQALFNKSLLFEMGSHLVEKSLIMDSVAPLANVLNTTLFQTTVNDDNELNINDAPSSNLPLVKDSIKDGKGRNEVLTFLIIVGVMGSVVIVGLLFAQSQNKTPKSKKD